VIEGAVLLGFGSLGSRDLGTRRSEVFDQALLWPCVSSVAYRTVCSDGSPEMTSTV